jgi:threonine dehydrogenase-like Zn-dependent dehydrogenase
MVKDLQIVFTGKERAALREADFDDNLAAGELLGRNLVSLVSTGSERGGFTQAFHDEAYPMRTGSSSIAEVLRAGENTAYKTGELFFHDQNHGLLVKIKEEDAVALPSGLAAEKAIFSRYCAVSMTSIFRMRARAVDNVIVTGLGLVGLMAAQILACLGYRVYAADPDRNRRDAAVLAGVANVAASLDAWTALKKSAGGMLECSGNEEALRLALPYMRPGSDIFQVGVPWRKCGDWDAHSLLYELFYSYVSLHGGWEWYLPKKPVGFEPHCSFAHVRTAMDFIAEGKIKVVPEMYESCDPFDCNGVYQEIAHPSRHWTSMMFDWRSIAAAV